MATVESIFHERKELLTCVTHNFMMIVSRFIAECRVKYSNHYSSTVIVTVVLARTEDL